MRPPSPKRRSHARWLGVLAAAAFLLAACGAPPPASTDRVGPSNRCDLGTGAPWAWGGDRPGEQAGAALAVGDLDGDGVGDLVVGAPGDLRDAALVPRVLIFFGGRDGLAEQPDVVLEGLRGSGFGRALAIADLSGDGRSELVVGAPGAQQDDGELVLYSGLPARREPARRLPAGPPGGLGGWSVAAADLDGDGRTELISGAPASDVVRVLGLAPDLAEVDHRDLAPAEASGARLGHALATLGDATGDGRPDVIVGAPQQEVGFARPGGAWLLTGDRLRLLHAAGDERPLARLGTSVGAVGDVDGDGLADGVAGAPRTGGHPGAILLLTGLAGTPAASELRASVEDLLGISVIGGDFDGDGAIELAAGWGDPTWTIYPGGVAVFGSGPGDGSALAQGTSAGLGGVVAAGDADGDPADELFAADPLASCRALSGGAVVRLRVTP